jgi:CheY-like chemotaxis protein
MSSDKEFRILIVDDQREVSRVLRTSLELLDRGYAIVDVPSGEEAILESGTFDLVVADYRLPGMSGLDLIERMKKKNDELKSIVISGYDLTKVAEKVEELDVFTTFKKPIESSDFADAVEEALHGPKAAATRPDMLVDKIGPIPVIDEGLVRLVLSAMRSDLGANAVMLVDRKGRVVQQHGTVGEDLRFGELVVLLAGNFTTTSEISTYLGEDPPAALHFYDGGNYDIYSLALGLHYFVAIIFPAGSERQMGAVVRFGTRAATELLSMVGGEEAMPKKRDEKPEEEPEPEAKEEAEEPEPEPETEIEEEPDKEEDEEEPVEVTAPDSIDLDALEAALETAADDDADSFWDEAEAEVEATAASSSQAISLDEAIELGLIPKDLGS